MEVSISAVKNSTSRLVNLIDLQILRSELQGRPVLSPFLQGIKTSSSNGSARELLEFICNSGQRQAVNALVGALKAEQTHPGHKEAYQLLVQVASEANTMNTTCTFCSDVLQSCICEIEKLDFSILMPLLLQRGLITQDIFTSMQATYVTPTQNAQSIIKAIVPLGVKGIVNFIAVLQTVPSKSNEELVEVLKTKISEIVSNEESLMSDDQYEMLLEAGIITAQSITTTTTATTSNAQLNTVSIEKKDRVAVIISMETYYNKEDITRRIATRLTNGQLLVERRNELELLYTELGCSVVNITEDIDNNNIQGVFNAKINGLCCKNTVVHLCVLGHAYLFKDKGMCLLIKDNILLPHLSKCITEQQIAKAILSLPTQYVTVIVDGIFENYEKELYTSMCPWQSLCPWDSRVVVYYTQPSVDDNEKFEQNEQSAGSLSNIIIRILRRWIQRGQISNALTHYNIFSMISAQWNPISHCVPCIKGDIDRVFLDSINKPLPYHFMGGVSADDHCKVILSTGTSLGFTRGERVKLYHIFVPEEVYNGVIDNNTVNTSTIIVTQSEKWTTMLADIKQNDMDGCNDHGTFVTVYKSTGIANNSICVDIQVDDSSEQNELRVFLNDFSIFKGKHQIMKIAKNAVNEFSVSSKNVQTLPPVSSIQLAKSLLMRVAINECIRSIQYPSGGNDAIHVQCYLYPQNDKPLLSKDGLKEREFVIYSSTCFDGCSAENALCNIEEESYWSPNQNNSMIYWGVSFPQNIFLKSIETRGVPSHPQCVPAGYDVQYRTRIMLCDKNGVVKKRFEAKSKHVPISLQCVDQLNNKICPVYTSQNQTMMTITPLVACLKPTIAFKLTHQANKDEAVLLQYQLEQNYSAMGYSFNHQPSTAGLITLPQQNDWLIVKYPTVGSEPISFILPPGVQLSKLLMHTPDGYPSQEYETPRMIELEFKDLSWCNLLRSCTTEKTPVQSGGLIPCCEMMLCPFPPPQTNRFSKPICLQTQLYGYTNISDLQLYEDDYLQVMIHYSATFVLYLVILCIEDTGNIAIVDSERLLPKSKGYHKLIRTFIPNGYKVANDYYTVLITSSPLYLPSFEQQDYYSVVDYNRQLTSAIEQDNREYWYTCNYKVTVRKRRQ